MAIPKNAIRTTSLVTLVILVLLAVLPFSSAGDYTVWSNDVQYSDLDFNYNFYQTELRVDESPNVVTASVDTIAIGGNIELDTLNGTYPSGIVAWKITAVDSAGDPQGFGDSSTRIKKYDGTVHTLNGLDDQTTWTSEGYVWIVESIDQTTGNYDWNYIYGFAVEEDDIIAKAYIPLITERVPEHLNLVLIDGYVVANRGIYDIANATENLIMAGFDIFDLIIIITGMVMLFFIVVFMWKLLEYFITRVALRRE